MRTRTTHSGARPARRASGAGSAPAGAATSAARPRRGPAGAAAALLLLSASAVALPPSPLSAARWPAVAPGAAAPAERLAEAATASPTTSWLPAALRRGRPGGARPVDLPLMAASDVLVAVPVPPDARLVLYEAGEPGTDDPTARYVVAPGTGVAAWYAGVLPVLGWEVAGGAAGTDRYVRGAWRLDVGPVDEGGAFELARDPSGARPVGTTTLDGVGPLPPGGIRLGYDVEDAFADAVRFPGAPDDAVREVESALASGGWSVASRSAGIAFRSVTLRRGDATLLAVFRQGAEGLDASFARPACGVDRPLDAGWPMPVESVYLQGVPAPPGAHVEGFERRRAESLASEAWRAECADLDLHWSSMREALAGAGWAVVDGPARDPGRLAAQVAHSSRGRVTIVMATDAATVTTALRAEESVLRPTAGRSLLYADLPLPSGVDPSRLDMRVQAPGSADTWTSREAYVLPPGARDPLIGMKDAMTGLGWAFDRVEPPEVGAAQVYHAHGDEVMVGVGYEAEDVPSIVTWRRRACDTDEPFVPAGAGTPSSGLGEMRVVPGAAFLGGEAGRERYLVRCTSLDLLLAWYRASMESGRWSLATTVGPDDPLHRELLFVRPGEGGLPPEQRTAWAEVKLDREWPYRIVVALARDPGGIRRPGRQR